MLPLVVAKARAANRQVSGTGGDDEEGFGDGIGASVLVLDRVGHGVYCQRLLPESALGAVGTVGTHMVLERRFEINEEKKTSQTGPRYRRCRAR